MPTATCEECGSEYDVSPSRVDSTRYCSWDCRVPDRIELVCECCGEPYDRTPATAAGSRFCSHACLVESQRKGEPRRCDGCGETYHRPPSNIGRYCSRDCYHEYGNDHPRWNSPAPTNLPDWLEDRAEEFNELRELPESAERSVDPLAGLSL